MKYALYTPQNPREETESREATEEMNKIVEETSDEQDFTMKLTRWGINHRGIGADDTTSREAAWEAWERVYKTETSHNVRVGVAAGTREGIISAYVVIKARTKLEAMEKVRGLLVRIDVQ